MQPSPRRDADPSPSMTDGAAAWSELNDVLDSISLLQVRAVELAGKVARSGTIEQIEGMPLERVLVLTQRTTHADAKMLIEAAYVLGDMPSTWTAFAAGELSWSVTRAVVTIARRLGREDRKRLDAAIEASRNLLAKFDPNDLIDAVSIAAAEIRGAAATERAEKRAAESAFVWAQPGLFGRGVLHSEMPNDALAITLNAIDAHTPADDGRTLANRRADGLRNLALHGLSCSSDGKSTAHARRRGRPSIVVHVQRSDVSVTAAGAIELHADGSIPVVTARALEALARDGSVQAVLWDGARPLAATRKVWAEQMPDDVRAAIQARDGGCRFPGCRSHRVGSEIHHFDKRGKGHHPEHAAVVCDQGHSLIHRHRWSVTLDPDTGEATFRRGNRTWTTLRRGTRLRRPPPRPGP